MMAKSNSNQQALDLDNLPQIICGSQGSPKSRYSLESMYTTCVTRGKWS